MYLVCTRAIRRDCYCNTVETSRKTETLHVFAMLRYGCLGMRSSSKASMALIAFLRTNENH